MKIKLVKGDNYLNGKVVEATADHYKGMEVWEFELYGTGFIIPRDWAKAVGDD